MPDWKIYSENQEPHDGINRLPAPPNWRQFKGLPNALDDRAPESNPHYISSGDEEQELVNAALYLRRPLLVTGKPGSGKSSLAKAVAYQLKLGKVLYWPITSRSSLQEGLYSYDAIGRLQQASLQNKKKEPPNIGEFIRLGPLGTALLPVRKPRVLLIDEIDKSDMDLPNDLLYVFEEGKYLIPELARVKNEHPNVEVLTHDDRAVTISAGSVECYAFPLVILTSNGEKAFPQPFLRRCIRLKIEQPKEDHLEKIVEIHLGSPISDDQKRLIKYFSDRVRSKDELATDQLLNAVYFAARGIDIESKEQLLKAILKPLSNA